MFMSLQALTVLNYILIKSDLSFNLNRWDELRFLSGNQLISINHSYLKQGKIAFLSDFFAEFEAYGVLKLKLELGGSGNLMKKESP